MKRDARFDFTIYYFLSRNRTIRFNHGNLHNFIVGRGYANYMPTQLFD